MANVDQCVRECEAALCGDLWLHAEQISHIPDAFRVKIFRGKSTHDIGILLTQCRQTIVATVISEYYPVTTASNNILLTPSSNNNKLGADIAHVLPSGKTIDIEVKFGGKTDKAIGMASFGEIFQTTLFDQYLSTEVRRGWLAQFEHEESDIPQTTRLRDVLNQAVSGFNDAMELKARMLPANAQRLMEQRILNNSGDGQKTDTRYLKFVLDGTNWHNAKSIPIGVGVWRVVPIKQLVTSRDRVRVRVVNDETSITIDYVLNWKNSYQTSSKGKVSAKLGFGTPSWNVWVV